MDLHLSLSMHSLLGHSNALPITPLSLIYSHTLSSHLPRGSPLLFVPTTLLKYTFLTNSSFPILSIWPNHLRVLLFTHSTPPHFHTLSCHISHTHPHCSTHPIYSLHTLLSGNSSLQHALLTVVLLSMSSCLTHMLELVIGYYSSDPSSHP